MEKPWHLYLVGGLALLWNAFGAADYVMVKLDFTPYTSNMPEGQAALIAAYPPWVTAVWAAAVWLPVFGAIALLAARKGAAALFGLSLVLMLVNGVYIFALSTPTLPEVAGPAVTGFWAAIVVVAVAEWLYARAMAKRGVLT